MSAIFYAEDLGIDIHDAERVADFMALAAKSPFVTKTSPWVGHGKVRVYFDPWSQNRRRVYQLADKWFYDCLADDVFAQGYFYSSWHLRRLSELVNLSPGNFSGAKTKRAMIDFSEIFYEQKTNRN